MLRKSRSKRHAKCSIKRYSKHSKTRIRRNMYRKKHKKTQRGGMFGLTSDKTQKELAACKEELAASKNLHKQSHDFYKGEIENREFFYKQQIMKLEVKHKVYEQRIHDVQTDLTNKLHDMKLAYDGCMDKYDSDTVKYNEAKTRMILKMKPDADITYHGYNSDWATFDTFGKNEYVKKIVREYMEHDDLDRAVQEYRDMPKTGSSKFYGEYGEHNPTYGNPS